MAKEETTKEAKTKGLCVLCGNKMDISIVPCGRTAFLEAECFKCGNAVDLMISAKTGRMLINTDGTMKL